MSHLVHSKKLLEILKAKHPELNCTGLVAFMFESGLIEEKRALRWIIKNEYFERVKDHSKNFTEHKLDMSIEYDVSVSFVNKVLYYYEDIKC
jgi:hypothetical protein